MTRGVPYLSLGALLLLAFAGPAPAQTEGGLLLGTAEPGSLRRPAPVLASDVHVEVAGVLARTRLTQIFRNPSDQPLEAVYVFPLPLGAAVDGLSLAIGQRAVRGRIVERAEAEGVGRQALAEGRKTAVLTREGPELFSVAVGAIAPGEEVDVVLDLQQMVAVEGGRFTLRFPMVARSAPGLPEEAAAGSAAPRRKASTTGTPSLVNPFDLHVDLYPGIRLGRIASHSHTVRVAEKPGPLYTVDLERAASADRDFVLSWEPVTGVEAQAALYAEEREGERYVLLMVMLPAGAPGLSDVAVRWDDAAAETWPRSLPSFKRGGSLVVAARLAPTASLAVLSGRRGGAPWEVVLPLSGAAPSPGIAKLWARLKVEALSS
ncbi:MAG TPA: VIT domain-containing protein, partial [Thermoanaerobaculia bacterium]|nr:VIT domain-containing protein [Thermoanaerobaculia bacterium]